MLFLSTHPVICVFFFHSEMNSESKMNIKEFDGVSMLYDFPPSALDIYRKKASFDWKQMKLLFIGRDMIEFQV